MASIRITPALAIDENEIDERFFHASGPGGQNVNKVETAVQLRFDAGRSPSLTDEIRARLKTIAGRKMTKDGILVVAAQRFRTQERNRADARTRLIAMLAAATVRPKPRKATKVSKAAKRKRVDEKTQRGHVKRLRGRPADEQS
jgi:ribosome-associated protein